MKKQKSGLYEKSLIRIILFLCINFIHFPLYGYYFKNIGVKDGLSQPSILSIHQDELGRMWFGTLQGLSIYDGNEMITLKGGEHAEQAGNWGIVIRRTRMEAPSLKG